MSNYILDTQTLLLNIVLSIFIGIIVGIDRDESWQTDKTLARSRFTFIKPGKHAVGLGGVRTYVLISILGFILGTLYLVEPSSFPLFIIGFLGLVTYISIAYFLNFFDRHTLGLTTEIGLLVLFAISGALGAHLLNPKIVVGIAVIVSLISNLKIELHKFVGSFSKREILESVEFIALTAVLLPWLPNTSYTFQQLFQLFGADAGNLGALTLINPYQIGVVIVFISGLNFIGYFLSKVTEASSSILLTGFLGGFVSSTSVTQFLADKSNTAKNTTTSKMLVASMLIANMTSFIRIPIILLALNLSLTINILPAMIILTVLTLIITYFFQKDKPKHAQNITVFRSPLALKPALALGTLFLVISVLTNIGKAALGNAGFIATVLLASLSGLDSVLIIVADAAKSIVSLDLASTIIVAAVITNLLFKLGMIYIYGEKRFKWYSTISLGSISLIGLLLIPLTRYL